MRDPPGDPGCAIDELHLRPERPGQLGYEQRKVRAGQHHRVDLAPARLIAQPGGGAREDCRIDALAAQLGLGRADQFARGPAQQAFAPRKLGLEPVDVALPDRRRSTEQTDRAAASQFCGGLNRGHRANNRHRQHIADHAQRDGRGGVAGNAD